jgi:hypothetical protein
MLSRRLGVLFGVLLLIMFIMVYILGFRHLSVFLIIPFLSLASIFVLHQDIDKWWYSKKPGNLPAGLRNFISENLPLFRYLGPEAKLNFEKEVMKFLRVKTFVLKGFDDIPEEIKAMLAIFAVLPMINRPIWSSKLAHFDNIVLYNHPFPSPQFPNHLHVSEIHYDDGVAVFSIPHFVQAFKSPLQFFNTALYEWSRIYLNKDFDFKIPYAQLEQISGFQNSGILKYIGLPETELDWRAVTIHHFYTFPVKFKMIHEKTYNILSDYLNIDPVKVLHS